MPKADSNNTTAAPVDRTRRRFITIAAGASIVSVGSLAAAAMPNATPEANLAPVDPIYAAIEDHKAARATWVKWVYAHGDLERELPCEKCQSRFDVWEEKIVETDDPRWIECERAVIRTSDAEMDATIPLVNITPTTRSGIITLLQHAVSNDTDGEGWPRDLVGDDGKTHCWQHFLLENVLEALAAEAT